MLVTTSYDPQDEIVTYSKQLAAEMAWSWIARGKQSIDGLKKTYDARQLLIVTQKELKYYEDDQPVFFFHPSLATIRFKDCCAGKQMRLSLTLAPHQVTQY